MPIPAIAPKAAEQRRHPRYELQLEVSAHSGHQFFTGFTENISAGGLFIATFQGQPMGHTLDVVFSIPGVDYEFRVKGEVRWVREYNESIPSMLPGMGVRFIDLTPTETEILNELLRRTETLFYDDDLG